MSRRVAIIGAVVLLALGGGAVAVVRAAKAAWWLDWKSGGKEGEGPPAHVPPDYLDRLAAGREHVEIVIGGRMLAQITGCG